MIRRRFAKIVATLGPNTQTKEQIKALHNAGADVFRINFSYGTDAEKIDLIQRVREVESEANSPIAILADLQGPKLRIGHFVNRTIDLKQGQNFDLDQDATPGTNRRVSFMEPWAYANIHTNSLLELDDGRVTLRVVEANLYRIRTIVESGDSLSSGKAILIPNLPKSRRALSDKDRADLSLALAQGVDWISASIGNNPDNAQELRDLITDDSGSNAGLMIKIDSRESVDAFDQLVKIADAIHLARGDIGTAMPVQEIPSLQKTLVAKARDWARPVVVAGQMLDSMVSAPAPTRAEASDVATAVFDGADAVTLSAETAVGDYPVEAVEMMNRVLMTAEADEGLSKGFGSAIATTRNASIGAAIAHAAAETAKALNCAAIVCNTTSGTTARRVARTRPTCPILCLSDNVQTTRRMSLVWGTKAVVSHKLKDWRDIVVTAEKLSKQAGMVQKGDTIAVTAGMPLNQSGTTNILRVVEIE